ncbi:MAG: adaptor protein MecA [Lachnospiraceae bacterium]|jgi:adapter protein MecA 1/2|nr:adaptor protein MecA [Lachnospiraceae bacterium]MCI1727084.1 adaptor protein MecA [Lachnospiraceae bacterium]
MKIEKLNDNQIRCTLTSSDLAGRQIRLSELAYGTDKAKALFRDMMLQARAEFGFEADNIPLMIEAIPVNSDSIVLIITKVEDPEELDTRFSKFTPSDDSPEPEYEPPITGVDDVIDVFHKMYDSRNKTLQKLKSSSPAAARAASVKGEVPVDLVKLFMFEDLDTVIDVTRGLKGFYKGVNSLYRMKKSGVYLLVVHQSRHTPEEFNKVCNILSEYGKGMDYTEASEMHLKEHEETIALRNALQKLSELS